jgi:hypothetical protein
MYSAYQIGSRNYSLLCYEFVFYANFFQQLFGQNLQKKIDGVSLRINPKTYVKAVTVSGYWQKPLTVTALTVIKFH